MAGKLKVEATFTDLSQDEIETKIRAVNADKFCLPLASQLLANPTNGVYLADVVITTDDSATQVAASGTMVLDQSKLTAGDIAYVGGIGFVATNGAVTLGQATFDMRTSSTASATSLAAQINAHATLDGAVSATSDTATVTITADVKGKASNGIKLDKKAYVKDAIKVNNVADSGTLTAATGSFTLVQASLTAGDVVYVGGVGFVATAGAVTPGQATFSLDTSDTAVGTSLAAQINAHATAAASVSATSNLGVVTVTSIARAAMANSIGLLKKAKIKDSIKVNAVADSTTLTAAAGTVTLVQASLTAGDVVYVGSVGFVATAGAVTLGQATFSLDTGDTEAATSLAAQINAHASLTGFASATSALGVVTITCGIRAALGNHFCLGKKVTTAAGVILNGGADTVTVSTLLSGAGTLEDAYVQRLAMASGAGTLEDAYIQRSATASGATTDAAVITLDLG